MATIPSTQTLDAGPSQAPQGSAAFALFPNASNHTIGGLDIRTAGRDMNISTVNINVQRTIAPLQSAHPSDVTSGRSIGQGDDCSQHLGLISRTTTRRGTISTILDLCHFVSNLITCGGGDHQTEGSVDVIPIESEAAVDVPPSLLPTNQEIYVRALLKIGLGLPCWQPAPLQANMLPEGIVPGDVGTYTVDRSFRKLFNLWEDESAIRALAATYSVGPYQPLQGRSTTEPMLQEGETLREGAHATSHLAALSATEPGVVHEFHCHAYSGAVLALTSPAHLLVTDDKDAMQSYIVQHVEAIYRHASTIRRVGERESLYVITGCIKSESWAMAAYREYMDPFLNTLELVRIPPSPQEGLNLAFEHRWTKQGTAWARISPVAVPVLSNQALFLQGFKVALTPRFRLRVTETSQNSDTMTPGPMDGSDHGHDFTHFPDPDSRGENDGGAGHGGTAGHTCGSSFGSWSLTLKSAESTLKDAASDAHSVIDDGDLFTEFPRPPEIGYHPSDSINAQLLKITSAEVAICHDDDWRTLFEACAPSSASDTSQSSRSEERRVCLTNGVVSILPKGCDEGLIIQRAAVQEASETLGSRHPDAKENLIEPGDLEHEERSERRFETVDAVRQRSRSVENYTERKYELANGLRMHVKTPASEGDRLTACPDITHMITYGKEGKEPRPGPSTPFSDLFVAYLEIGGGQPKFKVAIKIVKDSSGSRGPDSYEFVKKIKSRTEREAKVWYSLTSHDWMNQKEMFENNILPCYGLANLPGPSNQVPGFVMPWCEQGTVLQYIERNPSVKRKPLIHGIANGLRYIHERNFVHGDIKSANILLLSDLRPLISDFGCARILNIRDSPAFFKSSARYLAPELEIDSGSAGQDLEVPKHGTRFTKESDVWAFGMVGAEVLGGSVVFSKIRDHLVPLQVAEGARPQVSDFPNIKGPVELEAKDVWPVLEVCWATDPHDRCTMEDFLEEIVHLDGGDALSGEDWIGKTGGSS